MAEKGSEALFESSNLKLWSTCFDCYSTIVAEISAKKEKSSKAKPKKPSLVELDAWYTFTYPLKGYWCQGDTSQVVAHQACRASIVGRSHCLIQDTLVYAADCFGTLPFDAALLYHCA